MVKQYLEAGKIVATQGLRVEVRVEPWCDSPEFLTTFRRLYLEQGEKELTVPAARVHKTLAVLKLQGVDTVEEADKLRGKVLYISRADAKLPDGAHFVQDLIGLRVVDADSAEEYGTLTDVIKTGANDVYEVTGPDKKVYLLPVIPDVVIETDIINGVVRIRPIRGIFDDAD